MKQTDAVYLAHILDAINQIETYIADLTYAQLLKNRLVQDGVIRQLEIIGEASRNLSADFRPHIPRHPGPKLLALEIG